MQDFKWLVCIFYWIGERDFLSVASEKEIIKWQLFWKYAEGIQQGSSITMGDLKKICQDWFVFPFSLQEATLQKTHKNLHMHYHLQIFSYNNGEKVR